MEFQRCSCIKYGQHTSAEIAGGSCILEADNSVNHYHAENRIFRVNSLWPSDAIQYGDNRFWVNTGSGNGLLPDGTKPLPEPMLTFD